LKEMDVTKLHEQKFALYNQMSTTVSRDQLLIKK